VCVKVFLACRVCTKKIAHIQHVHSDSAAPGHVCSIAACALCYQGRVCFIVLPTHGHVLFYSKLFCLNVYVIWQPVLPLDMFVKSKTVLPLDKSLQQLPALALDMSVIQQLLLVLSRKVPTASCSCTAPVRICLQEPVLHLYMSHVCIQEPCAAPGTVCRQEPVLHLYDVRVLLCFLNGKRGSAKYEDYLLRAW
jgi:hypothetical protein